MAAEDCPGRLDGGRAGTGCGARRAGWRSDSAFLFQEASARMGAAGTQDFFRLTLTVSGFLACFPGLTSAGEPWQDSESKAGARGAGGDMGGDGMGAWGGSGSD